MKNIIHNKITANINVFYLKIYNDSKKHKLKKNFLQHYRIILVSKNFNNIELLQRHKKIYSILKIYIPNYIYALQMHLYNIHEWMSLPNKKFLMSYSCKNII